MASEMSHHAQIKGRVARRLAASCALLPGEALVLGQLEFG